ncbi:MAG: hypothetical protein U0X93_01830 [Anaerolineales bacterium]
MDLFSDRYYVGLLSLVLVMIFVAFDSLVLPHLKWNPLALQRLGAAVFFLWLAVYPGWSLVKYVSASMQNGEASGYNVYNNRAFHENPIIKEMQRIAQENPDATLYSNYTDGVWFFTRRDRRSCRARSPWTWMRSSRTIQAEHRDKARATSSGFCRTASIATPFRRNSWQRSLTLN